MRTIRSLYVYGPAGCGKTTNAEAIRKAYDLDRIVDDADLMGEREVGLPVFGVLALGNCRENAPAGFRALKYEDAARRAGVAA